MRKCSSPAELSNSAPDAMGSNSRGTLATMQLQRCEPYRVVLVDRWNRSMWFRRRNRPRPGAVTKVGADPDSSLVNDLSRRQAPLDAPNLSLDLRARNPRVASFEPDWRRLARNFVIGPGAAGDPSSAYSILRMRTLKSLEKNCWSTVAVTSPSQGSGNTLTAINLAINIARDLTHSVLLVELDLVSPSFNRLLGFENVRGMADYLLHDASLSEIAMDIGVDGLAIIPAGSSVTNSFELVSSRKMARFVEELKQLGDHQIVLFDLPSVLAFGDAVAFSPLVDCALLVVDEGSTKVSDVRRALTRLEHTKILGVVLNRSIGGDDEIGKASR